MQKFCKCHNSYSRSLQLIVPVTGVSDVVGGGFNNCYSIAVGKLDSAHIAGGQLVNCPTR